MSARLTLTKVVGAACVQDLGRAGQLALGLPRGGTLAPRWLRALNASVGNAPGDAALEVFGIVEFEVSAPVLVAIDGAPPFLAHPGVVTRVAVEGRRVRIVAFGGGIAVPPVLGGRGTLPTARIGGHEGRWLRSGDVLPLAHADASAPPAPCTLHEPLPAAPHAELIVPLHRGPHHGELVEPHTLPGRAFRLAATSDRTGIRLEGEALRTHARPAGAPSLPLVPGAIQLPPNGLPIVLGPDHPVTGGYPVVAVVAREALEALFVAPLGSRIVFVDRENAGRS
jgi:allophanate hydrolase subunit 2